MTSFHVQFCARNSLDILSKYPWLQVPRGDGPPAGQTRILLRPHQQPAPAGLRQVLSAAAGGAGGARHAGDPGLAGDPAVRVSPVQPGLGPRGQLGSESAKEFSMSQSR